MNQLATRDAEQALQKVILEGDLSKLTPLEKVGHYKNVCASLDLNPLTQPFSFIRFQGKEVLYAGKNCSEQLREKHGISVRIVARDKFDDLYVVTAEAKNKEGRYDSSTGAVNLKGLNGEALANAMMKAETKAKRRVTLSLAGLGFLDDCETDALPNAVKLNVDINTGEIIDNTPIKQNSNSAIMPPASTDIAEKKENEIFIRKHDVIIALHAIFDQKDALSGFELWAELTDDQKKQVWQGLTPEIQAWVKEFMKNTPIKVAN